MNVCILVDKNPSAIYNLAAGVKKYNPHWNIRITPLHPKRPSAEQVSQLHIDLTWADVVDVEYWKSGEKAKELYPDLWSNKRKILTHHNPYDLHQKDWKDYKMVIVKNQTQHADLPNSHVIPHTVDLNYFEYNKEYTRDKVVNMVIARIEGKKGAKEVARACKELGYKFKLVGRISKRDYFNQVMEAGGENIEFYENISDDELKDIYYESAIHVCNSIPGFESGTMPILESMACGVPVLTTNVGHVPDNFNGKNMVVRKGNHDDYDDLKKELKDLMENIDLRIKLRQNAWETVKNLGHERMARQYSKVFYKIAGEGKPLVSVIIPTRNRHETLIDSLAAAATQDYPNLEVVVADSSDDDGESVKKVIQEVKKLCKTNIKFIHFNASEDAYTLAEARNRAVIEAEGEYLMFCDDRLAMDKNAVSIFQEVSKSKSWCWGSKDNYRKGFVENFSFIRRDDFIQGGMFNERINKYGGMTQEVRTRYQKQDITFIGISTCNAMSIRRAGGKDGKRKYIVEMKLKLWKMYG